MAKYFSLRPHCFIELLCWFPVAAMASSQDLGTLREHLFFILLFRSAGVGLGSRWADITGSAGLVHCGHSKGGSSPCPFWLPEASAFSALPSCIFRGGYVESLTVLPVFASSDHSPERCSTLRAVIEMNPATSGRRPTFTLVQTSIPGTTRLAGQPGIPERKRRL